MLLPQLAPPAPYRSATTVPFPAYPSTMTERSLHRHLRKRVLLAMQLEGLRQSDVARATGISKSTLSAQIQNGRFDLEVLWKIAKAVGRDVRWFFPDEPVQGVPEERAAEVLGRIQEALEWGRRPGKGRPRG